MRHLAIALSLWSAPVIASAQLAPRSVAIELGYARDSAPALGEGMPVALVATWWLVGSLDATLRAAWRAVPRTDVHGSDAFEAGAGLRYTLAGLDVRPQVFAGASLVEVFPTSMAPGETGVRLALGVGLEAFLARDVFVAAMGEGSAVLLPSGEGAGLAASMRFGLYF